MTRATTPCTITAGKIVTLSVESFGAVSKSCIIIFKLSIIKNSNVFLAISTISNSR